jgi:hypothetical protein
MKKPTNKLSLNRETIRPLQATQLEQINGGSHVSVSVNPGTTVMTIGTSGTSVISSGTSVISRNPSGGSGIPSGG